ncbi:MAG: topoisomerase C-terminal repeat-containing protein [Deltaproteobacteria bacterium]|nr:topoisomerase C-terminal repeat-containing protein [Deltaproteobacteria bacterium]MCL5891872.1 topoisomerase C-terminal repeat-containing protein [Deltaproteobacteria bacterium]
MKCPSCGGNIKEIKETDLWIECENVKYDKETKTNTGSCDFKVFRKVAGKQLSSKTFQKLLGGETIFVEGFKKKNGEEFDTKVKLDIEEHKIVFVKDGEEDNAEEF